MTTDTTPEEIARARRWASMQSPEVIVRHVVDYPNKWLVQDVPDWAEFRQPEDFPKTEDAAWSALAIALRPVFASVAPVIIAECIEVCEEVGVTGSASNGARHIEIYADLHGCKK